MQDRLKMYHHVSIALDALTRAQDQLGYGDDGPAQDWGYVNRQMTIGLVNVLNAFKAGGKESVEAAMPWGTTKIDLKAAEEPGPVAPPANKTKLT